VRWLPEGFHHLASFVQLERTLPRPSYDVVPWLPVSVTSCLFGFFFFYRIGLLALFKPPNLEDQ
jgi:hypothetical protein